jgi:hypothetical protein
MRLRLILSALCAAFFFSFVHAQGTDGYPYKVEIVDKVLAVTREKEGKQGLYVTV